MQYTQILLNLVGLAFVLGLVVTLFVILVRTIRRDLNNFLGRRRARSERMALAVALRDARVDVHSVQLFDYEFDYGEGDVQEATCFEIEATISPAGDQAGAGWRPFCVDLAPVDYWSVDEETVVRSRVVNQNSWAKPEDNDLVVNGPARVKLVLELDPITKWGRFEYFGEKFGPEILLAVDDDAEMAVRRTVDRGALWRLWASPKVKEAIMTAATLLVSAAVYYLLD